MNHLGDTNKMVRECVSNEQVIGEATPNEELRRQILSPCVAKNEREWWAARTIENLEFELNAVNESFRKLNIHALDLAARIKRLEKAGDELIWAFCPASVSMMTERESDALKLWNKAKEDKP